jgi:hypothetical protein
MTTHLSAPAHPSHRWHTVRGVGVALAMIALIAGCSSAASTLPTTADQRESIAVGTPAPSTVPPPSNATPQQGSGFFAGSANAPVSFTVPVGWETLDAFFVLRSGADPAFGVAFYDVANLYADGCRWVQVDPPVGPSVDDLVEAYGEIPELRAGSARAITVDGFEGQELRFSVPDFDEATCKDGTYALVQADNAGSNTARPGAPNLWALTPGQQNQAWILDVDGTRLVVFAVHPATISAQDKADIDTILGSLQIG